MKSLLVLASWCAAGLAISAPDTELVRTGIVPTIITTPNALQEKDQNIQDAPEWTLKNVTRSTHEMGLQNALYLAYC